MTINWSEDFFLSTERPKAVVSIQPADQVFRGETVTLRCDIQGGGFSNWQYSWFKDGSSRPVSNEQQYRISSVTESHRGKYTCRGTERGTSRSSHTSDAVTLTVSALPRATLTVEPKWSPVFTGESVTLKCEIESYSNWRYQWYKGSSRTAVSQSQTNTFTIRSAADQDQDQYWCRGERDNRPTSSQPSTTVTLTVKERPKAVVSIQPADQVFRGETVTLRCDIQGGGFSNWQYSWFKDGSSRPVSNEQQYRISSVTESHRGKYTCRGTERGTSRSSHTSDAVTLTVSALPRATLTVEPKWSPVFTGESVTLKCEIESYSNWRYQWYKGSSRTAVKRPKAVVSIQPADQVFRGETVTLRCDIQGGGFSNWQYSWFKDDPFKPVSNKQQYRISSVTESHRGKYTCRGTERGTSRSSHSSDAVTLTVSEEPKPELTSSHKGAALTGNPVVLYCKLDQSAGWRFYWFRHSQSPENETRTETHSYTISSVSVSDGGQYWCRAGRGNPVYYTHYSDALWINTTRWGSVTGSTCNISSLNTSHTGVYWCESESGESSNPVNITVTNGLVILHSPVHPVTEGDPLTLHCLYRNPKTSNLTAEFYKNGSLLQTQTTGEMTIRTVSKSDEGLYHCKNPEKGESPQSWISVRGSDSKKVTVGVLVVLSLVLILIIILGLFWCYKKKKEDQQNINQTPVQSQNPGFTLLQTDSGPEPGDLTYAQIDLKDKKKPKKTQNKLLEDDSAAGSSDVTYAQVKTKKKKFRGKDSGPEPGDVTYAQINLKEKKPKKTQSKLQEGKSREGADTVYSELKH
ncbi:hypothetical protein AOLI_G00106250 [Acnodon oligacanthus]